MRAFSALGHGDLPTLLEDVNRDGMVNVLDLVRVSNRFEETAPAEKFSLP